MEGHDETLNDYTRLRLEYTRLHEDYRRLLNKHEKQSQLNDVGTNQELLPTSRYHQTLNSIDNRIKEAFNSETDQYWKYNLGLARKTIREEKQLYPLKNKDCIDNFKCPKDRNICERKGTYYCNRLCDLM
jgi:hypothetical protein